MKTILAITHLVEDEQLDYVDRVVKGCGVNIVRLCTNSGGDFDFAMESQGQDLTVFVGGKKFIPKVVWYATHPRTDALFCEKFRFPGEHRSAMYQFVMDLHYACRSTASWFPCDIYHIGQADSKPLLLLEAKQCGLIVPRSTLNATLQAKGGISEKMLYKKKLGFPCVVTFDKKNGTEVVSTTENSLGGKNAGREVWQWQTPVESQAHVRCCIVGQKIWAVVWRRKSEIGKLYDYRSDKKVDDWQNYILPAGVASNLLKLKKRLKLKVACPEFLIDTRGQHVFIDMNPCGDWYGFFEDAIRKEIVDAIARSLVRLFYK